MALRTLGTNTTTSLSAFSYSHNPGQQNAGLLRAGILNDLPIGGKVGSIWPDAFVQGGLLYVPNRGVLKLFDGDVIAFDPATGFPIVVSALAITSGSSNWHLV